MRILIWVMIGATLVLSAAIFGFFYAWVCSTMWGLDAADPRVSIAAMQAMNGSVRNAVFAPAFFGTPLVGGLTAMILWRQRHGTSAVWFAAGSIVYTALGLILTMLVNVPMNEALAQVAVPQDTAMAQDIWDTYSPKWQFWNQIRTVTSGIAFCMTFAGALTFARTSASARGRMPIA